MTQKKFAIYWGKQYVGSIESDLNNAVEDAIEYIREDEDFADEKGLRVRLAQRKNGDYIIKVK